MSDDADFSPALGGDAGGDLAPELGSSPGRGRRPWWRNLKGPIAVLLADLSAPSPRVRRRAAEALARLGDRRAASALAQGARDPSWEVRLACLAALECLGADGLGAVLARATRDGHPRVRQAAVQGLAAHGDARGLDALEALDRYLAACGQEGDRPQVAAALETLRRRLSR